MRLIDADELMKDLKNQIPLAENVSIFIDIIESQPAAYDVDKVVEQKNLSKTIESVYKQRDKEKEQIINALETQRVHYQNQVNNCRDKIYETHYRGVIRGYEYLIDIVKEGGVNDSSNN